MEKQASKTPVPTYVDTLDNLSRARYVDKVRLIGNKDPYEVRKTEWSMDVQQWPDVQHDDIYHYLVHTISAYSRQEFRAYKSLESYNYFVSGWVTMLGQLIVGEKHILSAKVRHSQRMNDKHLQPWVVTQKDGVILTAHCTCMAGLSETCSHIGALLFAVDATVKIRNSQTVTEKKAYWLLPSAVDKVGYHRVCDIDFTSAKTKKKQLDAAIKSAAATPDTKTRKKVPQCAPPTDEEVATLFESLSVEESVKPVVMSLIPGFSDKYRPKALDKKFPKLISELRDETLVAASPEAVKSHCDDLFDTIQVTEEESKNVESATRGQASSKEWFSFRTGRITASRIKSVCRTSLVRPSKSLVREICHPTKSFANKATQWGCDHEKEAKKTYEEHMRQEHVNFCLQESGLVLHPNYPYLGATPDAVVGCDCCGSVLVEIKCPYCRREEKIDENIQCLKDDEGHLRLDRNHSYYYQIQCQLLLTEREFCDFIVWTEVDFYRERISLDTDFCKTMVETAKTFFKCVILPEIVGKLFSRPLSELTSNAVDTCSASSTSQAVGAVADIHPDLICTCQTVYREGMKVVGCDNEDCPFKWLHFACVGLKRAPRAEKWFCPDCRKLPGLKPTKKKASKNQTK